MNWHENSWKQEKNTEKGIMEDLKTGWKSCEEEMQTSHLHAKSGSWEPLQGLL